MSASLADLISEAADSLPDVAARQVASGASEYRHGSRPFAVVDGGAIELLLPPDIAEAARRTPSTAASDRGPGWIRFAPAELDGHAADRARAWFRVAWRAARASR